MRERVQSYCGGHNQLGDPTLQYHLWMFLLRVHIIPFLSQ
jgi:hypothetical protein